MPAAVAKYVKTNSFLEADSVLSELKQTYIDDFVKYKSKVNPALLRQTLFSVAHQVGNNCLSTELSQVHNRHIFKRLSSLASVGALDFVACLNKKAANIHNRWFSCRRQRSLRFKE